MTEQIKEVKEFFSENYPHVAISEISDLEIETFLNQSYVKEDCDGKERDFRYKMNLLYDYVVSQGLVTVVP